MVPNMRVAKQKRIIRNSIITIVRVGSAAGEVGGVGEGEDWGSGFLVVWV